MASSFEFKRKLLENIIENLLCYKCKAAPGFFDKEKNRYVCMNAHQLCEDCKSKCDCGSKVGNRPNPLVHQILKDLPVYCPHYKTGCREMVMQAKDLEDHQIDCVFREVYCPGIGCYEKVVFKDISDHFSQSHAESWLNQEGKSIQSNFGLQMESKRWKMSPGNIDFFPILCKSTENGFLVLNLKKFSCR